MIQLLIEERLKETIDYLQDLIMHTQNMDRIMIMDELEEAIKKLKVLHYDIDKELV